MASKSTQQLVEIGIVVALYVALTWALAPLSYGPLQLRVPEILKSLVIWEPHLIPASAIGVLVGNITSPYVGPWELAFMPLANLIGALLCYLVGRRLPWVGAGIYALVVAGAVSPMLSVLLHAPIAVFFPGILASEAILIIGGVPVMRTVLRIVQPLRRGNPAIEPGPVHS